MTLLLVLPVHAQESSSTSNKPVQQQDEVTELSPVQVQGAEIDAWGPIDGYAAESSAAGTKTDTPLIETPQSISVISADQIDAQNAVSVREVMRYVGGVIPELRGNVASRYDQIKIRGFNPDIYLDGLKLLDNYYAAPQVDPYLVERVEVIKGPASVLYGQAPPGGLVNLVSKRPSQQAVNEVRFQAGEDDLLGLAFDVNGELDKNGDVLYRVAGSGLRRDGPQRLVEQERQSIAPSLSWEITEDTDITFLASYRQDPEAGAYGALPASGSVLPNPNGELPVDFYDGDPNFENYDREQTMLGYEFSHWFNDHVRFKQNARYQNVKIDYKSVYGAGLSPFDPQQRTLLRGTAASREDLDGYNLDNQLQAYVDTGAFSHTVLLGLDYSKVKNDRNSGFGAAPPLDAYNPTYYQNIMEPARAHTDYDQEQTGFYLQDQVKLGNWVFLAGGRYDDLETNTQTAGMPRQTQSENAFTVRGGVLYKFDNGIAPFFSYTESFQPQSNTDRFGNILDPTEGEQYELGIKYQPVNQRALITASVFELTQKNVAQPDPIANASIATGEVEVRGAEIEGRASTRNGFNVTAALTYLDSEITSANDGTEGNEFSQIPELTGSIWVDYTTLVGPLRGFGGGVGVRYIDNHFATNSNGLVIPSYTIVDAALHYDLGGLSQDLDGLRLGLNVQNVFDKKHVTTCYREETFCFFGEERQVIGTIAYSWN